MKIIQIADSHLVPSGRIVNGLGPEAQLRAAVDDILTRHPDAEPDGGFVRRWEPEAYALLRDILSPVLFPVR